jgi:hypothetical protein
MSSKKASEPGVLGNLPSTRPARLGRRRESAGGAATKERPKPRGKTAEGGTRRTPAPKAAPKKAAGPRAVRSAAPALERKPRREPPPRAQPAGPPRGAEIVTTAVKATGELAQIGFTVGGQMLKRAVRRLPRP